MIDSAGRHRRQEILRGWPIVYAAAFAAALLPASRAYAVESAAGEFPAVLETARITPTQLSTLAEVKENWSEDQQKTAAQLVHLLESFDAEQLDRWTVAETQASWTADTVGMLTWVAGIVKSCARRGSYYLCVVESETSPERLYLVVPEAPRAWLTEGDEIVPSGHVRARAVFAGSSSREGLAAPLLLTDRLQWRPTADVPAGWLALAEAGFDVSLLDSIRQHTPLAAGQAGREAEAFYTMLDAAARYDVTDLGDRTRAQLPSRIAAWQQATKPGELPDDDPSAERRRAVALAALRRAELGFSSVAPLFLSAQTEVGRLVLIEGTARRAVPIALPKGEATVAGDRYFELEVFTPDSQNLPVVCCVTGLPPEFPIGDVIRQRVRVSGFFFKMWQYRSRERVEAGNVKAYAPIVIGPTPQWLRQEVASGSSWLGASLGVFFLAVLAVIAWTLWRQSKRDRSARRRFTDHETIDLP